MTPHSMSRQIHKEHLVCVRACNFRLVYGVISTDISELLYPLTNIKLVKIVYVCRVHGQQQQQ